MIYILSKNDAETFAKLRKQHGYSLIKLAKEARISRFMARQLETPNVGVDSELYIQMRIFYNINNDSLSEIYNL